MGGLSMNSLQRLGWFLSGLAFWACASHGIDVAIFRGNTQKQRLERQVVVDGKKLRTSVDNAVKRIDRETMRKLEEFGYAKNGEMIKPYPVPSFVEEANE
jgi:hypothetical protein